jgi:heat shock protein HslJ
VVSEGYYKKGIIEKTLLIKRIIMTKKAWAITLFVMILLGLGACKNSAKRIDCDINDLNGKWKFVSIDGMEVKTEREAFLEFNTSNMRIHGSAGCNIINSTYEIDERNPSKITFKPAQMTMMMCPEMEAENAFSRIYPQIVSFSCIDGKSTLLLLDKDGKELIRLKK